MDWASCYPAYKAPISEEKSAATDLQSSGPITKDVEVADIGCGFGGLLVALAPKMPDTLLLGIFWHFTPLGGYVC